MLLRYLFVSLVIVLMLSPLFAAAHFVARIDNPLPLDLIRFQLEEKDICAYQPGQYLDLLLDEASYNVLKMEFPTLHVTQTEAQLKANLVSGTRDIPGYRTYQEMVDELMLLQAQYPSLMQTTMIGTGWGATYHDMAYPAYANFDHQLWAVKLSDNVQVHEDEPEFYFVGAHHAREPISTEVSMAILIQLLEGYNTDPQITDIVNNSQIWFVPLLNPDGHKIVLDQTDVWWRKNLIDNNSNHSIDLGDSGNGPDGTDLNRNYGYEWGYMSASGNPGSITYHGSEAFSELETQALRDLMNAHRFVAGIGYHSYGQYVLYPFGYMYDILSPENIEQQALAEAMAATIPSLTGSGTYTPMPSYSLYPVSGSFDDWAYATHGTFAHTIEMGTEFIPPAQDMQSIVTNNLTAARIMLQRPNTKTLKGHVTNALTGEALSARLFVHGIDDNPLMVHQSTSDSLFGSFLRFLPVGTHEVTFSKPGFISQTQPVTITADAPTLLDIAMLPVEPMILQIRITDMAGNPLSNAVLTFAENDINSLPSDADGLIFIPNFYPGFYRYSISCPGYEQLNRMEELLSNSIQFRLGSDPEITDDFETDLTIWQTTGTWGRSSAQHHSGGFSLTDSPTGNYGNNVNSSCRLIQPLNLTGALNANLQFFAKFNIALDGDYCELAYSTNGASWKYLDHFNGASDWQFYSYNLNHFLGGQLYLRFQMKSGYSGSGDGIYIDDLMIFVSANPTPSIDEIAPPLHINLSAGPNPFHEQLNFKIQGTKGITAPLSLAIYNLKGQLVRELYNRRPEAMELPVSWDGRDSQNQPCASGIYFARLSIAGKTIKSLKTVLIK